MGSIGDFMEIIFATTNMGKLREIRAFLADAGIDVISAAEAGVQEDVEETGETFEENAILKAESISKIAKKVVVAEDSGLEIDFLDKKPGVYSSRFMGEDTSYEIKNRKILELLKNVPENERTARYVSVFAAAFPDGKTITSRGEWEGIIGYEPKGENGFGYDPIFFDLDLKKTAAQMELEEKNKVSHRGKSLGKMKEKLTEELKKRGDLI